MARNINIVFRQPPVDVMQTSDIKNQDRSRESTYGDKVLPLMWGKVTERTGIQTVTVELANGLYLYNVPVGSSRWVKDKTENSDSYATGRKDIPQVGSKVLIAFINGIIDNPLVLPISGFDILDSYQTANLLLDDEQDIVREVDEYGWIYTFNKTTGKKVWQSPDNDDGKQITLTLDIENGKISVEHAYSSSSSASISLDADGFSIEDANGNTIESSDTTITLNGNLEVLQ